MQFSVYVCVREQNVLFLKTDDNTIETNFVKSYKDYIYFL